MTTSLRTAESDALDQGVRRELDRLWAAAFDGEFGAEDRDHAYGGVHVLADVGGRLVAHASAVPRTILVGGIAFDCGYVEAVATVPDLQGTGLGSQVMVRLQEEIRSRWQLGALSTGSPGFYERLGWERWRGPTYVITESGTVRTPEEDDALMVLRFGASASIDLAASITCHDRPGDAW